MTPVKTFSPHRAHRGELPSTPAAIANVREAMDLVQQAQVLLDRASQKLSSVRYGADLLDKTYALREKCHKHWYVLRKAVGNRGQMSLDSEPEVK